jgi:tetratricopeptide (TPR) repeat protein
MSAEKQTELQFLLHQIKGARLENRLDEADQFLTEALGLHPLSIPVLMEKALLLQQRSQWSKSREYLERILSKQPENPQVLDALGHTWQAENDYVKAIEYWLRAIRSHPEYPEVWQNIALAYEHLDNLPEAIAAHQKVVALLPENAKAVRYLGMAQLDYGLLPAAHHCFERALEIDPKDPENLWQRFYIRALVGDFPDAWSDYECRFSLPNRNTPDPGFKKPRWQGEEYQDKSLLLHAEQGFGDTLQMIRYIPRVSERVRQILVWVPPSLASLVAGLSQVDDVVTNKPDADKFDLHLPLMSLPGVFNDSLETIPNISPYIPTEETDQTKEFKKIGVCWAGSRNQPLDRRSVPIDSFQSLFNKNQFEFHSLQLSEAIPSCLQDRSSEMKNFRATVKVIEELDLVITIDTSIAHLAGAMGKPVWILLSFAPDWRWGYKGDSSPWYSSARLFRKNYGESWKEVISRLSQELEKNGRP